MHCTVCSVIPVDGNWFAKCGTVNQGPYLSAGIAVRIATSEALEMRRQGRRSRISVQNTAGDVEVEYCLCTRFKNAQSATLL
jgi:hypothetical protein